MVGKFTDNTCFQEPKCQSSAKKDTHLPHLRATSQTNCSISSACEVRSILVTCLPPGNNLCKFFLSN